MTNVFATVIFVWVLSALWNIFVIAPLMYRIRFATRGDGFAVVCILVPPLVTIMALGTLAVKIYGSSTDGIGGFYNRLMDNLSK